MTGDDGGDSTYDRQLLLLGAKRNAVLRLWEVERYGEDSYGDTDYVSVYGLTPSEWFARGIRLLGRTAVECTRDRLADAMGSDIAAVARTAAMARSFVVDPFVGSGNTLYWILRHLPGSSGLGFELDRDVYGLTKRNLSILGLPIDVVHCDYIAGLTELALPSEDLLISFVAPPWGEALSSTDGLDLRRTMPPVNEVIQVLSARFANPLLCAVQMYERVEPTSLSELRSRFDWSVQRTYDINAPGQNHGLLVCTKGWNPENRVDWATSVRDTED